MGNDIDSVVQANGSEFRFETTRLLLSLGADPTVRDGRGRTARAVAVAYGGRILDQFDRLTGRSG